jgi:uncharacterized membrane protein YdjX (TVP38/TMEM64 family)
MKKLILLGVVLLAIGAFFFFDAGQWLTLDQLKAQQASLESYRADNPILVALLYMLTYIVVTALSLPGAALMTLTGGAVFGVFWGTIFANISATIGATCAFLIARFVLGNWVQEKFGDRIEPINKGIEQDGGFYLFSLRLVPVFPFFIINVVMGLTKIKTLTFFWVSQIGMLAGAAVYANAGTQLAKIDSLSGIASPGLLISFALLGVFPIIARKSLEWFKGRRAVEPTESEG